MRTFIWVILVLEIINVIIPIVKLSTKRSVDPGADGISAVLNMGLTIWAAVLLF